MKLIVGLGNPGPKYQSTRHNVGFMVIDRLADYYHKRLTKEEKEALISKIRVGRETALLAKPQTFMNKSGKAVKKLVDYYQLSLEDILVVYDDLDLNIGQIRIKSSGGPGGHNGVKSVIGQLGTKDFPRLRIGIGRPAKGSVVNYVLDRFDKEQREEVDKAIDTACKAVREYLKDCDLETIMNRYN